MGEGSARRRFRILSTARGCSGGADARVLVDEEEVGGDVEDGEERCAGDVGRMSEGDVPNAEGPDRDRRRLCCLCQRAVRARPGEAKDAGDAGA